MSGVVRIEMWEIKNGYLEGVITNWLSNPDHPHIASARGKKTIRTSRIQKREGSLVKTHSGHFYELVGLSREQLIQQAKQ